MLSALKLIDNSKYVLIITHVNPDPDTICSGLALSNYLFENRIKHKVFNVGKNIPSNLDFINRYEKITDQIPKFYDLVISVDCGSKNRLGIDIKEDTPFINFDHHKSNDNIFEIVVLRPVYLHFV